MVVRAGMPTLPFYFFEGTIGLRPWIAEVSQMEVRAGMPTLPLGEGCTHYHWGRDAHTTIGGGMHTLPLGRDAHTTIPKQIRPKYSAEF
jgi:hypothetical protein